jgi:hypothetical protein
MIESKIALWRARVADWKASGLSCSEFAAGHGLVASTTTVSLWLVAHLTSQAAVVDLVFPN